MDLNLVKFFNDVEEQIKNATSALEKSKIYHDNTLILLKGFQNLSDDSKSQLGIEDEVKRIHNALQVQLSERRGYEQEKSKRRFPNPVKMMKKFKQHRALAQESWELFSLARTTSGSIEANYNIPEDRESLYTNAASFFTAVETLSQIGFEDEGDVDTIQDHTGNDQSDRQDNIQLPEHLVGLAEVLYSVPPTVSHLTLNVSNTVTYYRESILNSAPSGNATLNTRLNTIVDASYSGGSRVVSPSTLTAFHTDAESTVSSRIPNTSNSSGEPCHSRNSPLQPQCPPMTSLEFSDGASEQNESTSAEKQYSGTALSLSYSTTDNGTTRVEMPTINIAGSHNMGANKTVLQEQKPI